MRARRTLTVVGCHAGGEIGNVVTGGVLPPAGSDGLRADADAAARGRLAAAAAAARAARQRRLPREPGRAADAAGLRRRLHHHGADRVPARCPARTRSAPSRCCSRPGWSPMREPETVRAARGARRRGRGARRLPRRALRERRVTQRARASSSGSTRRSRSTGSARCSVDVSYGGMWYAIADAAALGFAIEPHEARDLSLAASAFARRRASSSRAPTPRTPQIAGVSIVQIAAPWQGVGAVTPQRRRRRARAGSTARRPARACRRGWPCCTRAA